MPRARTERTRSKAAILEDIAQGVERLQSFIPQIEDLGRDGFPYLEGARARTELQLKECIRKTFGEKSPEYEEYRKHRVSVETPSDTKQTVTFIKSLIAALEEKKLEVQGPKPSPPAEPPQPAPISRPHMSLVPPTTPTAQVTITPTAPAATPPIRMAVALTTNLDLPQPQTVQSAPQAAAQHSQVQVTESLQPGLEAPVVAPKPAPPQIAVPSHSVPETRNPPAPAPEIAPHATTPVIAFERAGASQTPLLPQPAAAKEESSPVVVPSQGPDTVRPLSQTQEIRPIPAPEPAIRSRPQTSASSRQPTMEPGEIVKPLCRRFHLVARQLRLRGEYRATLDVEDDLDVQDLLHALLRLHFDDIETVEWVPGYSNGASRIVFLLNDSQLGVVVKKTRTGLSTKDLAEHLRADIEYCRTLKRCSTLLCFVYDPEGRIGNPRGLEADLISISDQLTVDVYVAPK